MSEGPIFVSTGNAGSRVTHTLVERTPAFARRLGNDASVLAEEA